MANEITQSVALLDFNGKLKVQIPFESVLITQTAQGVIAKTLPVSSGAEADIDTTGITNIGLMYFKNLDATNFVKLGPKSGGVMAEAIRLKPGEHCTFRGVPTGVVYRWIADTATCSVYMVVLES